MTRLGLGWRRATRICCITTCISTVIANQAPFGPGAAHRAQACLSDVGGFDERYTRPSIEDIDLGARLRRAGRRIWLRPDVQATHLKRWTLRQFAALRCSDRAVPWTRLILREGYLPGDLNLDLRSRVSAGLAWLLMLICYRVWGRRSCCRWWRWSGCDWRR